MGMTAKLAIADFAATAKDMDMVFEFFRETDRRFSPFIADSELCALNRGATAMSAPMREVLDLAEESRQAMKGYFNIRRPDGMVDTSGLVKGWAIRGGAKILKERGHENFAVEIGGDIQTSGVMEDGGDWKVGIRSPFADAVVKILYPRGGGVATSGSYHQGTHIYDPHGGVPEGVVSLTVIADDILAADIAATAAFAMGKDGIYFLEKEPGLEAYAIDAMGRAKMTSGLAQYLS